MDKFLRAVVAALVILQDKDTERFKRAKYYLAANPILSWFFLTMPGRDDALFDSKHLSDFRSEFASDVKIIEEAERIDYSPNKDLLLKIRSLRIQLGGGDKANLIGEIKNKYTSHIKDLYKGGGVDEMLSNHVELKMLMDEKRFLYENAVELWTDVEDAIKDLGAINWRDPGTSLAILDPKNYQSFIKRNEMFTSGPVSFVRSVYFMYIPLSQVIQDQLMTGGKNGGSVMGGNPAAINSVIFSGGSARKHTKSADVKLTSLVRMLSKSQREALKELL